MNAIELFDYHVIGTDYEGTVIVPINATIHTIVDTINEALGVQVASADNLEFTNARTVKAYALAHIIEDWE